MQSSRSARTPTDVPTLFDEAFNHGDIALVMQRQADRTWRLAISNPLDVA